MSLPDLQSTPTHYDSLKISSNATSEQIKAAYRSMVMNHHPDKQPSNVNNAANITDSSSIALLNAVPATEVEGGDSNIEEKPEWKVNGKEDDVSTQALTTFHQIQAAYQCLRDPHKRRLYDESLTRKEEQKEWKCNGALVVNLSEMECDICCVVDEEDDIGVDGAPLQKMWFHPCRCGDSFQIFQEDMLKSINYYDHPSLGCESDILTDRTWQCESCSLAIRINVDMETNNT
ncbi:hypothetical protein ACHAWF_008768 [Thalassiosira exigua]